MLFIYDQSGTQAFWLDQLRQPGQFLAHANEVALPDLDALVTTFRDRIDGPSRYTRT